MVPTQQGGAAVVGAWEANEDMNGCSIELPVGRIENCWQENNPAEAVETMVGITPGQ